MRGLSLLLLLALHAPGEVIETMLAVAGADSPRHSEGDVVVLRDGTLLAAWSEFLGGGRDDSTARIAARTSRDGGRSWSAPYVLQETTGAQNVMSVSFLRLDGEILFFYGVKNSPRDLFFMVRRSADEGRTWSEPVRVISDPGYYVMNNARVVRLASGRLVCPTAFVEEVFRPNEEFRTVMYYSDDRGRTWRRGKGVSRAPRRGAMEPGLVELRDGRLLQIIRTQVGEVWHALSSDGGDTWTPAAPWTVRAPEAPSTIFRLPDGRLAIVYNPSVDLKAGHSGPRTPLVAATSQDDGRTWSEPKAVESDLSKTYAYTSATRDGERVHLTYYVSERGRISLRFKSLPIAWFR
ncbi:MAG: exo-alpha-sialidase [Bryobacterales bacterium]|nr:exo-alpha-sialidase [Bryobacterales bacterium]